VALPLLVVMTFAVARTVSRPVNTATIGPGVITLILALVAWIVTRGTEQLTALGDDALVAAQASHPPMSLVELEDVADGRELSWIIALQGAAVLKSGSLSVLYDAIMAPASKGGGGQGVKTAGCGGGVQFSGARCSAGGSGTACGTG
jgi:hypothetical protein